MAKQGSLSIDFCHCLETMSSALCEYGDPIGDRTLIRRLLHGLSVKFRHMVSNLKMKRPFPTLEEARTMLLLEDIDIDNAAADTTPPVPPSFVTAPNAAPRPPAASGGPGSANAGHGAPSSQRSSRRRGRDGKQQAAPSRGSDSPHPPAPFANPWASTVQFWPHPYGPGGAPGAPTRPPPAGFAAIPQQQQYPSVPAPHFYSASPPPPLHSPGASGLGAPPGFGYGGVPPVAYAVPPPQQ